MSKKILRANYKQILFVFLAFLMMVLVSYWYVSHIVNTQMLTIGEEMMNTAETTVMANLRETELTFDSSVQTVESMLSSGKTNQEILSFLRSLNSFFGQEDSSLPDFLSIYGYIRGEFLDGSDWVPPDTYIPQQRPWYIGAMQNPNEVFFSEPYLDADTGGMCISFSKMLCDEDGVCHGILGVDLDLSRITDYVANQQLAGGGYGILISNTMLITAHPDASVLGQDILTLGDGYAYLAERIASGEELSAVRFTDIDGTDSIAFFHTILNGWHIGTITPRANYYGPVYRLALVLGLLGFVLMVALSWMLLRIRAQQMRSDEENRSKSEFLSRMSHEMRTPMNAIIGMTNIALETTDSSRKDYCLQRVSEASGHLLGVINDILDMSKIEAGKLELSETDFDMQKMLQQVDSVVGFKIAERGQTYTCTLAPEVPRYIHADMQRLSQVITNLLGNAVKFTPENGHISLDVSHQGQDGDIHKLRFEVADTGIGISKEQQKRLFQSFEQADGSITRKYGGTGLGLSISRSIVRMMGGDILLDSEPGEGSRFWFVIPVTAVPKPASSEGDDFAAPVKHSYAGKRILLAEDVEINQEILLALLEDSGIQIDTADNGQQAVDMFARNPDVYDLIFMDIQMPLVDGIEATRRIRQLASPAAKTVPIIAMTANVFREDIEKFLAAGMNSHLGKPLVPDEIDKKLAQYL